MASIILSAVGSAIGGAVGGPPGAAIGAQIGETIGGQIDGALFGQSLHREGRRLEELSIQTSAYGKPIPNLFGKVRLGGNVIWARPLKEVATTTEVGGKGGAGGGSSSTEYAYYASFAVAICEGEIDSVDRIWADTYLLDLSQGNYRIYKGSEEQLPDPLIELFEQSHLTPAYRGLAYIVVEDFPLDIFGNRIPNFTFEVTRRALPAEIAGEPLEHHLKSMMMIPGSGEYVYDSVVQHKQEGQQTDFGFIATGYRGDVNMHNHENRANALVSIDQMLETCPNLEWVGVVVTWFGDNLDAGLCTLTPKVEFKDARIVDDEWQVAGYDRESAPLMTFVDDIPRYGGTPDDESVLRYIDALKAKGLKVMLFPMFFMDVEDKPWRGRVTGSAADVASFFTKADGYNAFIIHYANLTKDKADAFVIGSELIGLTQVHDGAAINRNFPAVDALVSLAAAVRTIMGATTELTYAADWSEYHHTQDGWYHLDPLWASTHIDYVGIDAYFPLTNAAPSSINLQEAVDGWTSGEGWDFYYTDEARTITAPLSQEYAWKNIEWWWKNSHVNPDGNSTPWVAESKAVWFTEYGFPSVDGATNQPNVFYDPSSSESFFPRLSTGRVDPASQRLGLLATELQWKDSSMVQRRFVWTWDARPYPYWPDLRSVWADGELWQTGHWVNGKLGVSGLAAIVQQLCARAGLTAEQIDVSQLDGTVEGYILPEQQTVRAAIESLMAAYFFDCVESDGQLKFVPRGGNAVREIAEASLLPNDTDNQRELLEVTRMQELELPQQVSVVYLNRSKNYQNGHQLAQRANVESQEKSTLNFPLVMAEGQAQQIAEMSLNTAWTGRTQLQFTLPPSQLRLEPSDIVTIEMEHNITHTARILQTTMGEGYQLRVTAALEDLTTYDAYREPEVADEPVLPVFTPQTSLALLDMPLLPGDAPQQALLRIAMQGQSAQWRGAVLYRSADAEQSWRSVITANEAAIMGAVLEILAADVNYAYQDNRTHILVNITGQGTLASATQAALLNGANAALVGDEVLQFSHAELVANGRYRLSGLLRGRLGTEWAMGSHEIGERFILLDNALLTDSDAASLIGLPRDYRAVSLGNTLGSANTIDFTHHAVGLRPYAPVHVKGQRDTSGNLMISWKRRSRTETGWRDSVETPLNEASEHYEIEVMDGSNVVRTLTSFVSSASYSAAEQIADFGAMQASVTVRISQLSAAIGRGYAAEVIV